jgi:excisionase family DNA binding protein
MKAAAAPAPERLTYRAAELAKLLGVSRTMIHDSCARGWIKSVRLGRVVLIPRAEVDRLLESWKR